MRRFLAALPVLLLAAAPLIPIDLQAQEPEPAPPTTQSQSGYPDVRREAADPSLFPDPDVTARNAVRTRTTRDSHGASDAGGRSGRAGARLNNQMLGQADADPLPIRVSYRRAKTLAMERNPHLAVLLKQADAAESDIEKRRYLRAYYVQLFGQVRKIDSSPAMKSHLEVLNQVTQQRYDPKRRMVAGEEDLITGRSNGRRDRAR